MRCNDSLSSVWWIFLFRYLANIYWVIIHQIVQINAWIVANILLKTFKRVLTKLSMCLPDANLVSISFTYMVCFAKLTSKAIQIMIEIWVGHLQRRRWNPSSKSLSLSHTKKQRFNSWTVIILPLLEYELCCIVWIWVPFLQWGRRLLISPIYFLLLVLLLTGHPHQLVRNRHCVLVCPHWPPPFIVHWHSHLKIIASIHHILLLLNLWGVILATNNRAPFLYQFYGIHRLPSSSFTIGSSESL